MQQFVYYLKYVLRDQLTIISITFLRYMFDHPVCVYNMC